MTINQPNCDIFHFSKPIVSVFSERISLRANDPELLGLEPAATSNSAATRAAWIKAEAIAKASIVLNLGPVVNVRVRPYIDSDDADEKTARQLWDQLKDTFRTSNAQAIQNVRNGLDALKYVDGKSWDSNLDKFNGIVAKLAKYGKSLGDDEQMALITCSLPESFAPITVALSAVGIGITQNLAAILSEDYCRKSKTLLVLETPAPSSRYSSKSCLRNRQRYEETIAQPQQWF